MDKSRIKAIIIRCVIIALTVSLAALYCMTLRYENMRTSENTIAGGTTADLGDGDVLIQKLKTDEGEETLYGVALLFAENVINPEGTVNVSVKRDGAVLEQWTRKGQFIQTSECEYFRFSEPQDCKGHSYEVVIAFDGFGDSKPFSLCKGAHGAEESSYINGERTSDTIFYLNIYDAVPLWQMIVIPVLVFMVFFLWQAFYFLYFKVRFKLGQDGDFASLYIALLLLYFLIVPLNTIPDDGNHFLRAYSIAHGKLISDVLPESGLIGDTLPEDVAEYAGRYNLNGLHDGHRQNDEPLKELEADWDHVVETGFPNTAINVPYMYFPQILGIKISEMFTNRPYVMAYCGRVFNMVITAFMVLFAIRFTPSGKEFFKLTALLPMMMQETVSLAPDGFIAALIMVYIAVIMRLRFKVKGELKLKHYLAVYILTILVVMCKMVYAPVCLLSFLVPSSKFGKRSRYYSSIALFGASVAVFLFSWMMIIQRYNLRLAYSNSAFQIDYIIGHPKEILMIFADYILNIGSNLSELIGGDLGFINIPVPTVVLLSFVVIAAVLCYRRCVLPKTPLYGGRTLPVVCFSLIYLLIGLSEFIYWTKVGASSVNGILGRYFLQIFPLMLFIPCGIDLDKEILPEKREIASFAVILSNLFAIVSIWIHTVY